MDRYHGKCLKIARGKIKEDDKYTCPICDYRVKIPRDAARPKLEDLQDWQADIPHLPFQADEEEVLEELINNGQEFRDFIRPYTNPLVSTPDEVTTQRFYLRKIEGADILLAFETNFFRQELHRWAPLAPQPPPILEHSLSTRKPRPTKQQRLMASLGIDNPDDLPLQYRTKPHTFKPHRRRASGDAGAAGAAPAAVRPPPLQPAPNKAGGGGGGPGPGTPNGVALSASTTTGPPSAASTGPPPSASNHHHPAYRPPAPASPAAPPDPHYANMFATASHTATGSPPPPSAAAAGAHGTAGGEFVTAATSSPPFARAALKSPPPYRPRTPPAGAAAGGGSSDRASGGGGGAADGGLQGLASPTGYSFAAAALGDAGGSSGRAEPLVLDARGTVCPPGFDPMWVGINADDEDAMDGGWAIDDENDRGGAGGLGVRNEAGEALEGLGVVGRSEEEGEREKEEARKLADEFLAS